MQQEIQIPLPVTIPQIQLVYITGSPHDPKQIIRTPDMAYKQFIASWDPNTIELVLECKVMYLNQAGQILGIYPLSTGGRVDSSCDSRLIFAGAILSAATNIIVCHNHPSGNLRFSNATQATAKRLEEGARILNLKLRDFLIISKTEYRSMNDEGMLLNN